MKFKLFYKIINFVLLDFDIQFSFFNLYKTEIHSFCIKFKNYQLFLIGYKYDPLRMMFYVNKT